LEILFEKEDDMENEKAKQDVYHEMDPWKHRTQRMRCSSCMWFVPKEETTIGRCRRHAPVMSGYPVVFYTDWCGDHKLDETK